MIAKSHRGDRPDKRGANAHLYFAGRGDGAVPCDHFSNLPSAPHAVRARKVGMMKGLTPAAGVSMPRTWPSPVSAGTAESNDVSVAPMMPIAVFLPLRRLPRVSPSAPFTWPSGTDPFLCSRGSDPFLAATIPFITSV